VKYEEVYRSYSYTNPWALQRLGATSICAHHALTKVRLTVLKVCMLWSRLFYCPTQAGWLSCLGWKVSNFDQQTRWLVAKPSGLGVVWY